MMLSFRTSCPPHLPAGFNWYGAKCKSQDQPPKWVEALVQGKSSDATSSDSEPSTTDATAPAESDAECLTSNCQDADPQSTSSDEVDDGPGDSDPAHHIVDSPITQLRVTEEKTVYPLRSRQRQARVKLIEGGGSDVTELCMTKL